MVFPKEFLEKVNFEKKSADDKKRMKNYFVGKDLIRYLGQPTVSMRRFF